MTVARTEAAIQALNHRRRLPPAAASPVALIPTRLAKPVRLAASQAHQVLPPPVKRGRRELVALQPARQVAKQVQKAERTLTRTRQIYYDPMS